jgi:pyruvate dehydrogenase E1 component alpha subunit
MGIALDGADSVAVACVGDGATSEGDFHQAMNFAAVFDAPCIFLVQNNQYAISVPVSAQSRSASIAHKAVAYGMPGVRCDGNDVLATLATMRQAAEYARGVGPVLVEAVTYRMEAHTTSDDPTRHRSDDEVELWARLDPIERYRAFLRSREIPSPDREVDTDRRAQEAATQLRSLVFDAPDPDPLVMFDHVFAQTTPALLEQRAELAAEIAGSVEGEAG